MATEAPANVNGVYEGQYSQPAELAASTPSHNSSAQSQASSTTQQKADPQEIGWYFVEQYYTTLSKTPERIHLFYSKKSQLVTGTEAEKVVPAVGSRAISEKIKTLDIQDCKVRVLNVDSQASFENIVVQVIGELSNKSQPHHKFVQTFVLATQPNGYFVLNDIFRYLNDDEDEIIEDQALENTVATTEAVAQVDQHKEETKATEEVVDNAAAAHAVDEKLEEAADQPVVTEEEEEEDEEQDEEEEPANGVEAEPEAVVATTEDLAKVTPDEIPAEPALEQPAEPEPTPTIEAPTKPVAEAVSTKKTWASLVGNKAPAIPALPATAANVTQPKVPRSVQAATTTAGTAKVPTEPVVSSQSSTTTASVPASVSTTSTAAAAAAAAVAQNNGWQTAEHSKKAKTPQQKNGDGIVHAYIKNVTDKVDARILRDVLEKYGELKYFDVSRPRNCAFVEFADPAGYAAAVAANPHDVGGEPISVEERRPRPGQFGGNNANFTRGGGNTGRGRGGGLQGRSGSQGSFPKEGRGGFTQRAGKSGNVTPKGRGGQTQAA